MWERIVLHYVTLLMPSQRQELLFSIYEFNSSLIGSPMNLNLSWYTTKYFVTTEYMSELSFLLLFSLLISLNAKPLNFVSRTVPVSRFVSRFPFLVT